MRNKSAMKLFILGIIIFLAQSTYQLPVTPSKEKQEPKAHVEGDAQQPNLENIIGKSKVYFVSTSVITKFQYFLDCQFATCANDDDNYSFNLFLSQSTKDI